MTSLTHDGLQKRSTAQRSRHDTYNHLKGAAPSQQQAEKAKGGEHAQRLCQLKLKCLLAPEFLKQQPDTKLEKADILEMMLNFLQHQFTCCQSMLLQVCREIVHFLSEDEMKTESQRRLLKHFQ
ncbi:transcription factor HES-5-like [Sinocyclocheilus grahami]|uniref:transcription factor HES-5-like n=1 Tax=Sinocyclocheilus grahami TaxID=75366 RepID=UPI0007AC87C1|nr:PREDICTED: transcription factor HES-5-like [Sinocyclocheilus grahami]